MYQVPSLQKKKGGKNLTNDVWLDPKAALLPDYTSFLPRGKHIQLSFHIISVQQQEQKFCFVSIPFVMPYLLCA